MNTSSPSFRQELEESIESHTLVRITRSVFESPGSFVDCYVLEATLDYVCCLIVDDRVRYDGFEIFRIADISSLQTPEPYAEFHETALLLRREVPPPYPTIELLSIRTILRSLNDVFPLLVIHREGVSTTTCEIGTITDFHSSSYCLWEIGPDACWDSHVSEYDYCDVTRIGFAGEYETALALVAENR